MAGGEPDGPSNAGRGNGDLAFGDAHCDRLVEARRFEPGADIANRQVTGMDGQ